MLNIIKTPHALILGLSLATKTLATATTVALCACLTSFSLGEESSKDKSPDLAKDSGKDALVLKVGVSDPLSKICACDCILDAANRDYEPWQAQLEKECGVKLDIQYFTQDSLLKEGVRHNDFDLLIGKAWFLQHVADDTKKPFTRLADLRMPEKDEDGLSGHFVVLKNSPLKSMDELKGKRIVLGPKTAYEKSYAARKKLESLGLHEPDIKLSEEYACKSAVMELQEGRADVAVISSYAEPYGCIIVVADPGDVRTIGTTDTIPFITVSASDKISPELKEKITKSLLAMKGDKVPKGLMSKGFAEPILCPELPKGESLDGKATSDKKQDQNSSESEGSKEKPSEEDPFNL